MARRKPLDLSSLDSTPIAPVDGSRPLTDDFLEAIDEMRASGSFEWADRTLRDMYDWIKEKRTYTDKQVVAVNNIRFARNWDELAF